MPRRSYSYNSIAVLLSLFLFCGAAVGEEEAFLPNRGKTAIGMSLPSVDSKSVSIWRVGSKSMLGVEIGTFRFRSSRTSLPDTNRDRNQVLIINPALTLKRFRPLNQNVAPFSYQTIYGFVDYKKKNSSDRSITWSAGVGLGLGVAWFPFQRVSLSLRQGIGLRFMHYTYDPLPDSPDPATNTSTLDFHASPMQLLALFHF